MGAVLATKFNTQTLKDMLSSDVHDGENLNQLVTSQNEIKSEQSQLHVAICPYRGLKNRHNLEATREIILREQERFNQECESSLHNNKKIAF